MANGSNGGGGNGGKAGKGKPSAAKVRKTSFDDFSIGIAKVNPF